MPHNGGALTSCNSQQLCALLCHPRHIIIGASGESAPRVSHFCPKTLMYNKYGSKPKSWWHPLETLNTIIIINLECAWQHFGIQSELWIKVKLDPKLDGED